jgi:6-phosphofructokinase 1
MIYFNNGKDNNIVAGIVTCGGLCPGLNNVIQSIVYTLYFRYGVTKCLGFRYGYEGMNPSVASPPLWLTVKPNQIKDSMGFEEFPVKDIHHFGGTILGSSRGPQPIESMVEYLCKLQVKMLFTIGGDG